MSSKMNFNLNICESRKEYKSDVYDDFNTLLTITTLLGIKIAYTPLKKIQSHYKKKSNAEYKKRATTVSNIIDDVKYKNDVMIMINKTIDIMLEKNVVIHDFVADFYDIMMDQINDNINFSFNIMNFMIKVADNSLETNKHIRFIIVLLILKICEIKGYSYINVTEDLMVSIYTSMLKFVSDIDYFEMVEPPICYQFHQSLLEVINYYSGKLNLDNPILHAAFHKITSHANKFIWDISKICKRSNEFLNKYNNRDNQNDDNQSLSSLIGTFDRKTLETAAVIEQTKPVLLEYIKSCMVSVMSLHSMLESVVVENFAPELVMHLSSFVSTTLLLLSDGTCPIYKVFHMNMETLELMKELFDLICYACKNEHFRYNLKESIGIIQDMYTKIKLSDTVKSQIQHYIEQINSFKDTEDLILIQNF